MKFARVVCGTAALAALTYLAWFHIIRAPGCCYEDWLVAYLSAIIFGPICAIAYVGLGIRESRARRPSSHR